MTDRRLDVLAIGNAIVDVIANADDDFLAAEGMHKGAMRPIAEVAAAKILYLEGYLWDPSDPRAAMYKAMDAARAAGTKVAFTLSDSFVVDRHRGDLLRLLEEGRIDILFANESEMLQLAGAGDF